jgi:hypothetical protein
VGSLSRRLLSFFEEGKAEGSFGVVGPEIKKNKDFKKLRRRKEKEGKRGKERERKNGEPAGSRSYLHTYAQTDFLRGNLSAKRNSKGSTTPIFYSAAEFPSAVPCAQHWCLEREREKYEETSLSLPLHLSLSLPSNLSMSFELWFFRRCASSTMRIRQFTRLRSLTSPRSTTWHTEKVKEGERVREGEKVSKWRDFIKTKEKSRCLLPLLPLLLLLLFTSYVVTMTWKR